MIFSRRKNKQSYIHYILLEEPVKDAKQIVEYADNRTVRKVINGKLYDTSKAKPILDCNISPRAVPNFDIGTFLSIPVRIYKGNTEWFFTYYSNIVIVDENWAKDVIGNNDAEKYIELFGEPELA